MQRIFLSGQPSYNCPPTLCTAPAPRAPLGPLHTSLGLDGVHVMFPLRNDDISIHSCVNLQYPFIRNPGDTKNARRDAQILNISLSVSRARGVMWRGGVACRGSLLCDGCKNGNMTGLYRRRHHHHHYHHHHQASCIIKSTTRAIFSGAS